MTDESLQTAYNGILVLFARPELGLSGEHRGVPKLAKELLKKHGEDYTAIGRELHDRECFRCWQAHACPAYTPHTPAQADEIADLYGGLIRDVADGTRRVIRTIERIHP